MPRMVIVATVVVCLLAAFAARSTTGQAERPSRAACEEAVRAGLQALTQQSIDEVAALIDDWGGAETAAALGLPEGCRVPPSVPAIEPLEDGRFMICLWWNPRSGALGEILDSSGGWTAGWWECIGPPGA